MTDSRWGRVLVRDAVPSFWGRLFAGDAIRYSQSTIGGIWIGGKVILGKSGLSYLPGWWERIFHVNLKEYFISFSEIQHIRVTGEKRLGTVALLLNNGDFIFQCNKANGIANSIVEAARNHSQ